MENEAGKCLRIKQLPATQILRLNLFFTRPTRASCIFWNNDSHKVIKVKSQGNNVILHRCFLASLKYLKGGLFCKRNKKKTSNNPQMVIRCTHRSATASYWGLFGIGLEVSLGPAGTARLPTRSSRWWPCGVPQRPQPKALKLSPTCFSCFPSRGLELLTKTNNNSNTNNYNNNDRVTEKQDNRQIIELMNKN